MKKGHLVSLAVLILVLLNIDSGKGQSLVITKKDGTATSGLLNGSKISFSGSNLIFTASNGMSFPFAVSELSKITFTANSSSISNEKVGASTLAVYPNPARDFIRLEGLPAGGLLVQIFRIDGSLVFSAVKESTTSIEIASLAPGVYIVKADGQTSKFIKK